MNVTHIGNLKQSVKHGLLLKKLQSLNLLKILVRTIHWHEHKAKKKSKNYFEKDWWKVDQKCSFWKKKKMGKVRKHRQACNNQAKKELFGIRTKL